MFRVSFLTTENGHHNSVLSVGLNAAGIERNHLRSSCLQTVVNVTGTLPGPFTFSHVAIACQPTVAGEIIDTLGVLIDNHLNIPNASFTGLHPTFGPYEQLVLFNDTTNLTLGDSQLINVNNTALLAIVIFQNTTSVLVDNLVTYGCSSSYVLQFDYLISDLSGSLVQLQRSNFSNAPAGGIMVGNHSLTVQDTTFDTLTTTQSAINHDNTDGATLSVSNCSFNNIVAASDSASAITLSQARLSLTDSSITNCKVTYGVVVIYSGGDSVSNSTSQTVTINNCHFLYNRAGQGVVYMLGYDKDPQQTMNIYDSSFAQNYGDLGGAVTLFAVGTVNIEGYGEAFFQTFMGRYNDFDMGLDIRDCSFTDNSAAFLTRTAPESETEPIDFLTGGAALNVLDVQFSFMSNNVFKNNIGRQGSGANLDTCFFSVFWNNTFDNNTATQQGAAIALVNSHNLGVLVVNSTLTNGQAVTGGAIYGDAGATITISNGSQLTNNQALTDGGAVYCDSCQALLLQLDSNISANQAGAYGGAAYCTSCVTLTAVGVSMSNNRAANGGAVGVLGSGVTLTNLTGNIFEANTANDILSSATNDGDGGAVNIMGGAVALTNNTFHSNVATLYGGAIFYSQGCIATHTIPGFTAEGFLWAGLAPELAQAAGTCSYFNSSADVFHNNSATAAGAVLFSTDANSTAIYCQSTISPPDHEDCPEWGQTAPNTLGSVGYGPGLAFPAASILLNGSSHYNNTLPYISDGTSTLALPTVTVLDQAKHIVVLPGLTANLTVLNNTSPDLASLTSQTQASGSNGNISFSSVILVAAPQLWRLQVALSSYPGVTAAVIQGNTSALVTCQNITYHNQLQISSPEEASCDLTLPLNSSDPASYLRQLCSAGYYGPVCSLCVKTDDKRYGRAGPLQCQKCKSNAVILLAYIISTLLVLAWLSYTVYVTLEENEEAAAGSTDPGRTSQIIRAFNIWLQYSSLLGNLNLSTPKSVSVIFSAASLAFTSVTSGILSLDCLLSGPVSHAQQGLFIHLSFPLIMLILVSALQLLWWWRAQKRAAASAAINPAAASHQQHSTAELRRRLLITFLEVTFYYFPSLLTNTLELFACFHIDPAAGAGYHNAQENWGHGYWIPDMGQKCYVGMHRNLAIWLGTPMMLLTWLVIPIMPAFLLFLHRKELGKPGIQLQFGYIYRCYRPQLCFWNSVVLYFTLILTAAQVLATALNTYFQLTIMLMILMIGITALAHFQPFPDPLLQRMQVLGLFTVGVTATGCLYFMDTTNVANPRGLDAVGAGLGQVQFPAGKLTRQQQLV
ncbi:hypothetical protein WJX82_006250 [Trebouxia sp. C0006]